MEHRSLIFLHIPKAGGTTLHRIVGRQYDEAATFNVNGGDVHASIAHFCELPAPEKQRVACLKGHMPFGLHVHLTPPCAYVTMLRDPVDRLISHYFYVLRTPHHYLYDQVTSQQMTLRDYIESEVSTELINGQTRLIAGVGRAKLPSDALELAKEKPARALCGGGPHGAVRRVADPHEASPG